jgi:hypothetical protein
MCSDFERDGRRLLRQAALVVRLSARNCDPDKDLPLDLSGRLCPGYVAQSHPMRWC